MDSNGTVNEELRSIFLDNRDHILASSNATNNISEFNSPLIGTAETDRNAWGRRLMTFIRDISEACQENAFKINIHFGYILRHVETGDFPYCVPHSGPGFFDSPIVINTPSDWNALLSQLADDNIWGHVFGLRENTKWVVSHVTNVRAYVYHLNYVMGAPDQLPEYIVSNRNIISLYKDSNGRSYNDNLCAFRALAAHRNIRQGLSYKHNLESKTNALAQMWHTPYLSFDELSMFEQHFDIGVDIYSLTPDNCVVPRYVTLRRHGDCMVLNLSDGGHLSYVSNVSAYLCKYQCELCQSNFDRLQNLKRHMKSCSKQTKHKFPGGYYTLPMTVFDKLERVDVVVPHSERFYDFLATFDCESALRPVRKLLDDDDDDDEGFCQLFT